MKKRILSILLIIALLCPMLSLGASADATVYITNSGTKYHSYGCRYLKDSCHAVTLGEALAMGYTACAVCHAPGAGSHTHNWGNGSVTKAATCGEAGVRTYKCPCGETKTESIPAAGAHSWNSGNVCVQPTCTESGKFVYQCTVCGGTKTELIPPTGEHIWDSGVMSAPPTEEANGTITYTCTKCGAIKTSAVPPVGEPFCDVKKSAVYHDAVIWASDIGITTGYGNYEFRPNADCTRAQVVTFLWRAAGCPAPAAVKNPFIDVSAKQSNGSENPYYEAILWAAENGITTGFGGGLFKPNDKVTRAQFVTFLFRFAGAPASDGSVEIFADAGQISTPYKNAVAWAVEKGITTGYEDDTFRPNTICTRWAVVLFMYRYMA